MKNVLVTGGTHGIGKAIVESLSKQYNTYTCARGTYTSPINFIKCDLTKEEDINNLLHILPEIDILVCNSGGGGRWGSDNWLETDFNVWQQVYDKNVTYTIKLINAYLPHMIERKWGRVIAITSTLGKESTNSGKPWYQIAKSAQISLLKAFSRNKNYVRNGITFNCVSPGAIMIEDTGWHKFQMEDSVEYEKYLNTLPMGKIGLPEDIANAVEFLCKPESSFINGTNIVVDGGQSFSF